MRIRRSNPVDSRRRRTSGVFLPPPRLRFQHVYWKHASVVSAHGRDDDLCRRALRVVVRDPDWVSGHCPSLSRSYRYSQALCGTAAACFGILLAHEMGHYLYCRRYNIDATLPYFIPAPFLTGTLGAVIKIREAFPTRTALFDVGVAGPIAGFVVLVPLLGLGLSMSEIVPPPTQGAGLHFRRTAAVSSGRPT